jgi:cyclic pyranopterin phosphate synthase
LHPVKVNCVVMRGVNDDEVVDLAAFGRAKGVGVRFIEFMPLDAQGEWSMDQVVPAREILDAIDAVFPLVSGGAHPSGAHPHSSPDRSPRGGVPAARALASAEPAERFEYADGEGDVGVIASVTEPFCGDCDRVRVTAEGKFRTCLFALEETDLRAVLRGGGTDDDLDDAIRAAVGTKWAGHRIGQVTFVRPPRSMSQIGG